MPKGRKKLLTKHQYLKPCPRCQCQRTVENTYSAGISRTRHCRKCTLILSAEHRAKNPQYWKEISRWAKIKKAYGMTKDDYNNLLLLQGGRCAICGNLPQENSYLAVDHNHITHKPRGLLCTLCNLGLAAIERDGFVERATDYLGVYTDANKERVDQASTTKASQRTTKPARKSRARSSQVKGGVEPAPDILPGQLSYIDQSESTNNGDSAGGSHQ